MSDLAIQIQDRRTAKLAAARKPVVGVTGPSGFIAGHLARRLESRDEATAAACDREAFHHPGMLEKFLSSCDTIVHLAGVNRGDDGDLYATNVLLAERLVEGLARCARPPHVIVSSSTQRELDNAYGRAKREVERRLAAWATSTGGRLTVLVIPNVYGPGCQPFYNSVVATFCHQLARGQQPTVHEDREVEFVWINDLVDRIVEASGAPPAEPGETVVRRVPPTARLLVTELLSKLAAFRGSYFDQQVVPNLADPLDASLYATFLSHVEMDDHRHRPPVHSDERGRLVEIIRLAGGGQVFFSTTKPGVIRGNHFHTRKIEWFCVLRGEAVIRLRRTGDRRAGDSRVREFRVTGASPEFISIPPLCAHQIENVGKEDLLTVFWSSEVFQPADPDTFAEKVA